MTDYYLDLPVLDSIPKAYGSTASSLMQASGNNLGNFASRHGLRSLMPMEKYRVIDYTGFQNVLDQQSTVSSLVISCANWICEHEAYETHNGTRADLIERANCPVTVFGLGAQADRGSTALHLGPNTVRLLSILSERSQCISVRDEFTASVLEAYGIKNAVVTGCPSNFINLDPKLGSHIVQHCQNKISEQSAWRDLRIHVTEFSGGHAPSGTLLRQILTLLRHSSSFYILQEPRILSFLFGESSELPAIYRTHLPEGFTLRALHEMLRSKALHFSSVESWLDFARTCHLSIGMRIHGNMIPLQAGVPSVVIGHDSRTSGLASAMGIPVMEPDAFIGYRDSSVENLYAYIGDVMRSYDQRRTQLATVFFDYMQSNGIEMKPQFLDFCAK